MAVILSFGCALANINFIISAFIFVFASSSGISDIGILNQVVSIFPLGVLYSTLNPFIFLSLLSCFFYHQGFNWLNIVLDDSDIKKSVQLVEMCRFFRCAVKAGCKAVAILKINMYP